MSSLLLPFDRPDDPQPPIPVALAISRGQRVVNRPVKLLIAFGLVLALAGFRLSPWFVLAAPLGWIVGWCWWSYAVPHWRTWAIARGADPRALQYFGEKVKLLWPKGHWGERTEFGSRELRQAQQPTEPYRCDEAVVAVQGGFSPGFLEPPSNRTFLMGVVYWTLAMPLGTMIMNQFVARPTPVGENLFIGLLSGVMIAAIAYRRTRWQANVSPEHAIGLGALGVLLVGAVLITGKSPVTPLQIAFSTLFLVAPGYLIWQALREWRRRLPPANES